MSNFPTDEIALRDREGERQLEYALSNLAALKQDAHEHREHLAKTSRTNTLANLAVIVLLLGFILIALSMGKDQFILELTKYTLAALGGGGVGYIWGFKRGATPPAQPLSPPPPTP